MSKESLIDLIKDEARLEAEKILSSAKEQIAKITSDNEKMISDKKETISREFAKKREILASSKEAQLNSLEKASNLRVIHHALGSLTVKSAEILLSDSAVRNHIRNWVSGWKDGNIRVGERISESIPEIAEIAQKQNLVIIPGAKDYEIVFEANGYNEVLDLVDECRRVVDDDADEFVAILTKS
ncbi:MAG: hypothetical protein R2883_07550 [Caldisericia bacterium]